jgi:pimeloyl-ACP methyl ester carboxylesterase
MPVPPPTPLERELVTFDRTTLTFARAGRRWPFRRDRLVLIHGTGCSADSWRYQVLGLSADLEVTAIDLPGHGASSADVEPSIEVYAEAVGGLVQRLGKRRVVLAGHSMGGAVALEVALMRPELLKGLVLVAAAAYLDTLAFTPDILLWAIATVPHKFKGMFFSKSVAGEALAIARSDVRRCSLETVLGDVAVCKRFDFRGRLGELGLPALILCGSDDLITPVRHSRLLHKEIEGSVLTVIEGAGHMLPLEAPEQVNAAIRDFIRGA